MNDASRPPNAYVIEDAWAKLARATPARIALGRAGTGLPTREVLRFALAHAQARDAVDSPEASGDAIAEEFERYLRRREGRAGDDRSGGNGP